MTVVATVPKSQVRRSGSRSRNSKGRARVNIRVWWQDDFGQWLPGKQRVSLTPGQIWAVCGNCAAINVALKEARL